MEKAFHLAQWIFLDLFCCSTALKSKFRLDQHLIALAITDPLPHSLSAMYTFFAPEHAERSLGTHAVLSQLDLARRMNRKWLYLGYQVDACRKMKYKTRFHPHELLCGHEWKTSTANEE